MNAAREQLHGKGAEREFDEQSEQTSNNMFSNLVNHTAAMSTWSLDQSWLPLSKLNRL